MVMYVVSGIIILLVFLNYFLGYKLYREPKNEAYFHNVKHYNIIHQRDIMTSPMYVVAISSTLRNLFWTL